MINDRYQVLQTMPVHEAMVALKEREDGAIDTADVLGWVTLSMNGLVSIRGLLRFNDGVGPSTLEDEEGFLGYYPVASAIRMLAAKTKELAKQIPANAPTNGKAKQRVR